MERQSEFRSVSHDIGDRFRGAGIQAVLIRPFLGKLTRAAGAIPIRAAKWRWIWPAGGSLHAEVSLPAEVDGEFVWQGQRQPLHPGKNSLAMGAAR